MRAHPVLHAIETRAERAIAQELAVMTRDVLMLRPTLDVEDRAYADGLLLKLDQLIRNQQLDPVCGVPRTDLTVIQARPSSSNQIVDLPAPEAMVSEV